MSGHREERLQILLSQDELMLIDDFRFKQRMPTRAAAVRELLKLGLAAVGTVADGQKSSNYGLFNRSTDGHRGADSE